MSNLSRSTAPNNPCTRASKWFDGPAWTWCAPAREKYKIPETRNTRNTESLKSHLFYNQKNPGNEKYNNPEHKTRNTKSRRREIREMQDEKTRNSGDRNAWKVIGFISKDENTGRIPENTGEIPDEKREMQDEKYEKYEKFAVANFVLYVCVYIYICIYIIYIYIYACLQIGMLIRRRAGRSCTQFTTGNKWERTMWEHEHLRFTLYRNWAWGWPNAETPV